MLGQSSAKRRRLEALSQRAQPGNPAERQQPESQTGSSDGLVYASLPRGWLPVQLEPALQGLQLPEDPGALARAAVHAHNPSATPQAYDFLKAKLFLSSMGQGSKNESTGDSAASKLQSERQLKRRGLAGVDAGLRHSDLKPLAAAWQQYAAAFINQHAQPVSKLDLHGCEGRVCRSRNPIIQHSSGIVIKVTGSAWHILTDGDKHVVCPKKGCDWQFKAAGLTMVASEGNL